MALILKAVNGYSFISFVEYDYTSFNEKIKDFMNIYTCNFIFSLKYGK